MNPLISLALSLGAKIYGSVSGGKDGQAMVRTLMQNAVLLEGLLHCDLGRAEWPQSLQMCERQAEEYSLPLHVLTRPDGLDLLAYIRRRLDKQKAEGKPTLCWPSAMARYCTSDLKRLPANKFFIASGHGLIISAEGIRAEESKARAKKEPLSIRPGVTSSFYKGMTVAEALEAYKPGKRLVLNWYPVFNFTIEEVWDTYPVWSWDSGASALARIRKAYKKNGFVSPLWPFHPAYAMGNDRVSCMFCILGSTNDLEVAAKQAPELLEAYIAIEEESGFTFKNNFSLKSLQKTTPTYEDPNP